MVPLRDDNPTTITPYITCGLIGINIFIFFYQANLNSEQLEYFFHLYALVPKELTASFHGLSINQPVPEWMTLITSQFLHGGILHLGGNMLYLWIFGCNIEEQLGHFKYLVFYLACGVLAALSQWFFSQLSTVPILGASGAIAGVMGAYILRFPRAQILTLLPVGFLIMTVRIPALFFLGFWFFQQALFSFASLNVPANTGTGGGGIAYWAHAGGFVFGFILGPLLGLFSSRSRR